MRRLSLFVHTPVTSSLNSGIVALARGDFFSVHALKLDEELFPLLIEAKPCVVLASVSDQESTALVYQLLKEFKEHRKTNGSAAKDPAIRIVVVAEGAMPKLNWASLGIYELIIGPVAANVLTYKLNRHFQKALDAGEIEPNLEPRLVKQTEIKPESKTRDWVSFSTGSPEKIETVLFKKDENYQEQISLRVHLAGVTPESGEWKKSDVQMDPPPEWNWINQESAGTGSPWSFRGMKPVYHPEDKTWQFTSDAPKLLKHEGNRQSVSTEFEYVPRPGHPAEGKLNVRPHVDLKSVHRQTYYRPDPPEDFSSAEDEIEDLDFLDGSETSGVRERPKQNFGEAPRDRDEEGTESAPVASKRRPSSSLLDKALADLNRAQASSGLDLSKTSEGQNVKSAVKQSLSANGEDFKTELPLENSQASSLPVVSNTLHPRKIDYGEMPEDSEVTLPVVKPPRTREENEDASKTERGELSGLDARDFEVNDSSKVARATGTKNKVDASLAGRENKDRASETIAQSSAKLPKAKESDPLRSRGLRPEVGKTLSASAAPDEARKISELKSSNAAAGPTLGDLRSSGSTDRNVSDFREKASHASDEENASTLIRKDKETGATSILYDDEIHTQRKSSKEETDLDLATDANAWQARILKKNEVAANSPGALPGGPRIPLAPPKKLSDDEKLNLIQRIIRFIMAFFKKE